MSNKTTHTVFFSPTGTTRSVIQAISRGVGRESETVLDITRTAPSGTPTFSHEDLVVVGMPVYGGRLPTIAAERFQSLEGRDTPAVAIVAYGNRAYEDALAELCDLCAAQGFKVVSAAAFVGQHSFSSSEHPIAAGRPDQADLRQAEVFGRQLRGEIFGSLDLGQIPGTRPYAKQAMQPAPAATTANMELCIGCGKCAERCPVQCIGMDGKIPITQPDGCIWCMACVQTCPTGAREIALPKIHESAKRLHTHCQIRKEPVIFQPLEKQECHLPNQKEKMKTLIIFNHQPYDGSDVTWNGLRLAGQLAEAGQEVRIFLMSDSVDMARDACVPPPEYDQNLSDILKELIASGVPVRVCGTCMARCGIYKNQPYFQGAEKSTMPELAEWVVECDKVITF